MDIYMWVPKLKFKAEFDTVSVDLWMKVNANKSSCNENNGVFFYGIRGYLNIFGAWIITGGKWLCLKLSWMIMFQWEFMVLRSLSAWI